VFQQVTGKRLVEGRLRVAAGASQAGHEGPAKRVDRRSGGDLRLQVGLIHAEVGGDRGGDHPFGGEQVLERRAPRAGLEAITCMWVRCFSARKFWSATTSGRIDSAAQDLDDGGVVQPAESGSSAGKVELFCGAGEWGWVVVLARRVDDEAHVFYEDV
jgi:hypothetical protein